MPLDTALLSANLLSSQIGLLKKGAPKEIFTKVRQKAIETTKKKSRSHSGIGYNKYPVSFIKKGVWGTVEISWHWAIYFKHIQL